MERYQDWYVEKVLEKLNRGVYAHDNKMDLRLTVIKPIHALWIIIMFKHLKGSKECIFQVLERHTFLMLFLPPAI